MNIIYTTSNNTFIIDTDLDVSRAYIQGGAGSSFIKTLTTSPTILIVNASVLLFGTCNFLFFKPVFESSR